MIIIYSGIKTNKDLKGIFQNLWKLSLALLLISVISTNVFAQAPANDDPCNAISLTATQNCTYQTFTNEFATATTGVPAPGCASYQGSDVWFKVTVPCTGSLIIDTETGVILDGGMAVYSGDCTNLILIDCDDDGSQNGTMSFISVSGQAPGTDLWIRVWEYGGNNNGTFGICVSMPPQSAFCSSALPFCTSNIYTFPNNTNQPSLGGGGIYGCLTTTPNPVWYYMQVQNAGDITIGISQTNSSGTGIDVDFALWGPFPSFAASCTGLSATNIVDCSYSPSATETAVITNAQVGEVYIMLLTNFANAAGTITFQQTGGIGSSNCLVICNITASNTGPVCPGGSFDLSASTVANATYNWTGPNCFSGTGQTITGVVAPSTPGTYTYTVSATTAFGSTCAATTTVTVGSTSTATPTVTNTSCPGVSNGSISISQSSPGTYTYTLNPGNVIQTNPLFPGLAANTYTITFTNGVGCTGVVNNIVVAPGPGLAVTGSGTATTCPTVNNGTVIASPGIPGTYTYTLNPGNVVQPGPTFTGLAAGTYSVMITNAAGCTGTANGIVVSPGPNLTSTFTKSDPSCANINNGQITISPAGGAPFTFTLTGPGGPYTQTNPTFTNLAPGSYNYSFTNVAGCTGTGGPIVLTTNALLATTVNMVMPLCNGNSNGSITLAALGGVAPYQYSINAGGTYQPTGTFSNLPAGVHTIRIRDNVGCTKDIPVTLNQPTALTASATTSNATCNGNDGTITVTGGGGTTPYQYSIDNGATYQNNPAFTAPAVGPYSTIKVKDANGCVAATSATVAYTDNMTLFAGNDTTICAEQSITLQPQTNPGTSVFQWSPRTALNSDTIKNPIASPTATITYTLNAWYGPCTKQDNITVTVLNKPVANAGPDVTICDNDSTLLAGNATNLSGTVNYLWSPGASVRYDTASSTIAIPNSTQLYTLTVTDNYGCNFSISDNVLVTVRSPVPAYAGKDTIAVLGQPHQLTATGGISYIWSPSSLLSSPFSPTPLAILTNNTKFTVIVTDIAGCLGYDTVFVKAYAGPTYYTPNAFSPNGDGLNDIFRAIPVGIAKTDYFRVFNRYGELVFETNQWLKGWDGNYKGKKQPMGVYVWIIKGTDKLGSTVEMKGTVMLVQ